jgi:DNA-binding NarL/FixJ family response regulator
VQFFAGGAPKGAVARRAVRLPTMIGTMTSNAGPRAEPTGEQGAAQSVEHGAAHGVEHGAAHDTEKSAENSAGKSAHASAEHWALLVEDHPLYSEALVNTLLRASPRLHCRAVGGVLHARREMAEHGLPTLLLSDHRLPDGDGLQLLAEMAHRVPMRVLLSGQDDVSLVHRARAAGLSAFMPKTLPPDDMVLALRRVLAGEAWFPRGTVAAPPTLTERQLEVLREVGRGLSNREIAARLGVSERTVKDHLSIVFVRLGAANRAEALVQASAQGLLQFSSLQ